MLLSCGLQKNFESFSIDISFDIKDELVVLFGYSGAGKTVTLKMIAGLMHPDAGRISFNSELFFDSQQQVHAPPQQRRIGYVFQDHNLFPHMTVGENILYGAQGKGAGKHLQLAEEMIEQFQLADLRKLYPGEISGGQKQRVAFARALSRGPELLLLDEPFSALDNPIRVEMRKLLLEIREMFSVPVIMVTHDLGEAVQLADRMIIMEQGQILQVGTPTEIIEAPINDTVRALVSLESYYPQKLRDMRQQ